MKYIKPVGKARKEEESTMEAAAENQGVMRMLSLSERRFNKIRSWLEIQPPAQPPAPP
jgi:hypothetical protein